MAENVVVKEQLTDAMIEAGEILLLKLDQLGLGMSAAFWFFDFELNDWRLCFARPGVALHGSRALQLEVVKAMHGLGQQVSEILLLTRVLDSEAELVKWLRKAAGTGPANRARVRRTAVDGHYIDDVLIYRMN